MQSRFVISFVGISVLGCGAARAAVTFTNIADANTTAPGHTAKFSQFHNPSISGNDLTFLAFYSGGFGYYTSTVSPVANFKVIDTGDTAAGHVIGGLGNNGGISGSDVAIEVLYSAGGGLYHGTVGSTTVSKIVETGTTAPGQTTAFSDFGDVKPSGTHVAFEGFYNNGIGSGIYSSTFTGTALTKIVDANSTAPGQGSFTQFNAPTISGNNIAFWGKATNEGIYTGTVGTAGATKIADQTDSPLGHTHFTGFEQDPSVSGSMVAFRGIYSGVGGIYSATIGTSGVTKVAETGDPAGNTGGNFLSVQNPSTNGHGVEFFAGYSSPSGNKSGIFIETDGTITNVISAGDSLFGGVIQFLSVGNSAYDGYRVTFGYQLTNGVAGIAVADLPEPGSAGLILLAGSSALLRRRRRDSI